MHSAATHIDSLRSMVTPQPLVASAYTRARHRIGREHVRRDRVALVPAGHAIGDPARDRVVALGMVVEDLAVATQGLLLLRDVQGPIRRAIELARLVVGVVGREAPAVLVEE